MVVQSVPLATVATVATVALSEPTVGETGEEESTGTPTPTSWKQIRKDT